MIRNKFFLFFGLSVGFLAIFSFSGFQQDPLASLVEPGNILKTKVVRSGKASWYSQKSPGINKRTASNEVFDDSELTCAMWNVPFHQWVKVTNKANGKFVIVRVNDRGPHRRYVKRGRIIDLSQAAFKKIAPLKKGLIDIELELL